MRDRRVAERRQPDDPASKAHFGFDPLSLELSPLSCEEAGGAGGLFESFGSVALLEVASMPLGAFGTVCSSCIARSVSPASSEGQIASARTMASSIAFCSSGRGL